jgi:hypothetical protein
LPAHQIFHKATVTVESNIWNADQKVHSPEEVFLIPKKTITGLRSHNQPSTPSGDIGKTAGENSQPSVKKVGGSKDCCPLSYPFSYANLIHL